LDRLHLGDNAFAALDLMKTTPEDTPVFGCGVGCNVQQGDRQHS
jgi:hypothetical protein